MKSETLYAVVSKTKPKIMADWQARPTLSFWRQNAVTLKSRYPKHAAKVVKVTLTWC